MSKNAMSHGRRYNDDGFFTKYGRGDRGGRRLEFTTHDGLGHAVSRVCSPRGCWADAMAMRARALAKAEMTKSTPATEVEVEPTQCPKSPLNINYIQLDGLDAEGEEKRLEYRGLDALQRARADALAFLEALDPWRSCFLTAWDTSGRMHEIAL